MSEFQWLFDPALAAHVRTPLLILAAVIVLIIAATAVLVGRALNRQRKAPPAAPADEEPAEDAPC